MGDVLGAGAVVASASLGCAPIAAKVRRRAEPATFTLPDIPATPAVRTFARAGFGHRPEDLASYAEIGHERTVERLLRADREEDAGLKLQLHRLDALRLESSEQLDLRRETVMLQLQQAAVLSAVFGANPLQERMVDFWTNHFNIYARKDLASWRKGPDERKVVRANALSRFEEMLRASARSPAMLGYLDNALNTANSPNENYARELLELHTMGVDGGYSQRDVQEVARCFTGWTLEDRFLKPKGSFRFDPDRHDDGAKTVLGETIPPGGGERDGDRVLEIVARHPATARHLARKLVSALCGDTERFPKLEDEVARTYRETGGQIRAMLRPILLSEPFLHGPPMLKRPLDFVASALRGLDADSDAGPALLASLAAMGQAPYEWPMPDGYPTESSAWVGSMLPRWNFAFDLAAGKIEGTGLRGDVEPDRLVATLLGHPSPLSIGLAIASPEFQWK